MTQPIDPDFEAPIVDEEFPDDNETDVTPWEEDDNPTSLAGKEVEEPSE